MTKTDKSDEVSTTATGSDVAPTKATLTKSALPAIDETAPAAAVEENVPKGVSAIRNKFMLAAGQGGMPGMTQLLLHIYPLPYFLSLSVLLNKTRDLSGVSSNQLNHASSKLKKVPPPMPVKIDASALDPVVKGPIILPMYVQASILYVCHKLSLSLSLCLSLSLSPSLPCLVLFSIFAVGLHSSAHWLHLLFFLIVFRLYQFYHSYDVYYVQFYGRRRFACHVPRRGTLSYYFVSLSWLIIFFHARWLNIKMPVDRL